MEKRIVPINVSSKILKYVWFASFWDEKLGAGGEGEGIFPTYSMKSGDLKVA